MQPLKALPLIELQNRLSTKWRDFPTDVLPLPVAEMDFEIAEPIRNQLIEMLNRSDTLNVSFITVCFLRIKKIFREDLFPFVFGFISLNFYFFCFNNCIINDQIIKV